MVDIRIKRVYDAVSPEDGTRVLVDRLWPRGVRKTDLVMDLWLKEAAPSPDLRHWFGHDPARWTEFGQRYRQELVQDSAAVQTLCDLARKGPLTLLYAAHDTAHTHALVLADVVRHAVQS
ncbi:DUF488 domain-containing protein [Acetobacter vaccinii]|uniref:DUF488 domain-containing protein n=1 Tax=Acetobacter vaccinii TaxID=2592655 RepID=A0A5C1YQH3_9PROT|nr:DUF488 domain-containing protein [Acetobacter vaccinii]QEO17042.1 DUF488 domain-containing protein [Acetobacter vaccinii]